MKVLCTNCNTWSELTNALEYCYACGSRCADMITAFHALKEKQNKAVNYRKKYVGNPVITLMLSLVALVIVWGIMLGVPLFFGLHVPKVFEQFIFWGLVIGMSGIFFFSFLADWFVAHKTPKHFTVEEKKYIQF